MGAVVGIIGGGQLGRMLAEAASSAGLAERISRTIVLDPTPGCPASQAGAGQIVAGFRDSAAIRELASRADIVTYEIESGDADVLESVQGETQVSPSPATLRVIQDKLLQKSFLRDRGIAVADFAGVETRGQLDESLARFGCPAILKARRDGYDGRGNYRIASPGAAGEALGYFGGRPVMVERAVDFGMEVSVIAARNTRGRIATYPAVENMHGEGILRTTVAPARAPRAVLDEAERVARRTMEVLEGAGVFGIEMFVERQGGAVLVNEIAPRVHNSGHHTLVSSETTQFEQHLRAVLGMDLGPTRLLRPAVMCNILGPDGFEGPYSCAGAPVAGGAAHLKMYGKADSKPRRKLGHLTVVGDEGAAADAAGMGALLDRALAAHRAVRIEPAAGRAARP